MPGKLPAPTTHTKYRAAAPLQTPDGEFTFVEYTDHTKLQSGERLEVNTMDKVNLPSRHIAEARVAAVTVHTGGSGKGECTLVLVQKNNEAVSCKITELAPEDITRCGANDSTDAKMDAERERVKKHSGGWIAKHRLSHGKRPRSPPAPGSVEFDVVQGREKRLREEIAKLNETVSAREADVETLNEQLAAEKRTVKSQKSEIKTMKEKLAAAEEAKKGLQQQLQQHRGPSAAEGPAAGAYTHTHPPYYPAPYPAQYYAPPPQPAPSASPCPSCYPAYPHAHPPMHPPPPPMQAPCPHQHHFY